MLSVGAGRLYPTKGASAPPVALFIVISRGSGLIFVMTNVGRSRGADRNARAYLGQVSRRNLAA